MYQRMLDKQKTPSLFEMAAHCEINATAFLFLNEWLSDAYSTIQKPVFPYGNKYGWGVAHYKKAKLMCNIFPEQGAFTIMLRLTNEQWATVAVKASDYMKAYIDNKYPCSEGGWVHYRVTHWGQLDAIMYALILRCC